jgi:hypothetical protein
MGASIPILAEPPAKAQVSGLGTVGLRTQDSGTLSPVWWGSTPPYASMRWQSSLSPESNSPDSCFNWWPSRGRLS